MLRMITWALLEASLALGSPEIPAIPETYIITYEQGKMLAKGSPSRGLYDPKAEIFYLVKTKEGEMPEPVDMYLTTVHEMVHHIQNAQGRLVRIGERKPTIKECDQWFATETEALDIEDTRRGVVGAEKVDRLMYVVVKSACTEGY